jgi:hypothetical protein
MRDERETGKYSPSSVTRTNCHDLETLSMATNLFQMKGPQVFVSMSQISTASGTPLNDIRISRIHRYQTDVTVTRSDDGSSPFEHA